MTGGKKNSAVLNDTTPIDYATWIAVCEHGSRPSAAGVSQHRTTFTRIHTHT